MLAGPGLSTDPLFNRAVSKLSGRGNRTGHNDASLSVSMIFWVILLASVLRYNAVCLGHVSPSVGVSVQTLVDSRLCHVEYPGTLGNPCLALHSAEKCWVEKCGISRPLTSEQPPKPITGCSEA